MGDTVFVNGKSAVHAGSAGQSIAFPDVNLCPPTPPAGPIPTPLPNMIQAADMQGGGSSVLIEGNPMGKKSSFIAKSTGNEAAQSTGGGVVSHVVQGKAYFTSYSMDVTVEGEEAPRHLDMLTHNHAAQSPPNAAMGTFLAMMNPAVMPPADDQKPERKDDQRTVEFFVDQVDGKAPEGIDSMTLTSDDKAYDQTVSVSSAPLKSGLFSLKFEKVLPGKFYSLYWTVGGEKMPLFENVPFSQILAHTPGAEDPEEPEDEEEDEDEDEDEDEEDEDESEDGGEDEDEGEDEGGDEEEAAANAAGDDEEDDEDGEEDDGGPAVDENWIAEVANTPIEDDGSDPTADHPDDWYDPDPWSRDA